MPQLYVPDLLRKLNLLVSHTGFKNVAEIAKDIDVNASTLRSWTKDHVGRDAGTVSKHGREKIIRIFCAHLKEHSEAQVIDLLEGPYEDLEDVFLNQNRQSLSEFIEKHANFKGAELILNRGKSLIPDVVKRLFKRRAYDRSQKPEPDIWPHEPHPQIVIVKPFPNYKPVEFISIGEEFRVEFRRNHRAKHFLGLQQSSQGWGVIETSPMKDERLVHMPKPLDTGELALMAEYHHFGPSRFTLIQSTKPFPEPIVASLKDNIPLSRTDIRMLLGYLQDVPSSDRTLTAIDVGFMRD